MQELKICQKQNFEGKALTLTIQTMVHCFGDRKYFAVTMITTVVFISHPTRFSIRINRIFFKKKIYWVSFDACLEDVST